MEKSWRLTVQGKTTYHDTFIEAVESITYDQPLTSDDIELIHTRNREELYNPIRCIAIGSCLEGLERMFADKEYFGIPTERLEKRITTLAELNEAREARRAVIIPGSWGDKPLPAAAMINQTGETLLFLFTMGMFIYKPKPKSKKGWGKL